MSLVIFFDLYDIAPYVAGIPEFPINKEIDEYWNNMLLGKNREKKLKNIKVSRNIFYGRVKYLNLEGNVEF